MTFLCDVDPTAELVQVRVDFTGTNVKINRFWDLCIPDDNRVVARTKVSDQVIELDFEGFNSDEAVSVGLDLERLDSGADTPLGSDYEGGVIELTFEVASAPWMESVVAAFVQTDAFEATASF
jgi:hypothetical protein